MPSDETKKEITIKSPLNINIENSKTQDRRILEFIPNKLKEGEAIIVKTKRWTGISEACFAVCLKDGKLNIQQLK